MITIVFCDVVGSTPLAEQLDPEEFLEIMNDAFEVLIPSVLRLEGTVSRLMGDAVLALFGTRVAREDDPERAVRAALEMTENARLYAARLARERGIEGFAVRVGINTGLVVVGTVGAELQVEHTAMGDAVNLAARMQSAAPPGGVLITHETYRQVRGRFDLVPKPPLQVKGYAEPVRTYLVKGIRSLPFRPGNRGVEGIATRMVGRERELAELQKAFDDASERRVTRVVTVLGEAGIGKSRLLDEFVRWLDARKPDPWPEDGPGGAAAGRVQYWRGRATRSTEQAPYALLRDLFARRFGILDSDSAAQALDHFRQGMAGVLDQDQADLAGHLAGFDFSSSPAVRALLPSSALGQIATAALRRGLHALWKLGPRSHWSEAALAGAGEPAPANSLLPPHPPKEVGHSAVSRPDNQASVEPDGLDTVVLLLEDIHWADDASLDLVAGLLGEALHAPVLVLITARPELVERHPKWGGGRGPHLRIDLWPLTRRRSRTLVADILQRAPSAPEQLLEMLVDNAEGNPFFLEELVKMLIEDGTIVTGADEWHIDVQKLGQVRLPPTLTAVLQARLDALPPEERLVLQRASVIGKQFWDDLVTRLAPEVRDPRAALEALEARELVFRYQQLAFVGVQEYTFKHAILQQVTYETVLLQVRRTCHAEVARWLEARAGERLGEYLALIALHYRLAGKAGLAAAWYRRAGERAANLGANGEARKLFETALELLPPDDLEQRWLALAGHDKVVGVLGDSEARQAADAALVALAEQMGDDSRLAEAHYRRGHYLGVLSRQGEALDALDAALAAAERAGNLDVRANAFSLKVVTLARLGRMAEASAIARQALAHAEALDEPETLARALSNVSIYFAAIGDLGEAARLIERQAEIMERAGNLVGQAVSLGNLGYYYLFLGLYPSARATLERALTLSEVIAARRERLYNQLNLGVACWRTGLGQRARDLLEAAIPELEALGDSFARATGQTYLGLVLAECGEHSAGVAKLMEAQTTLSAIGARGAATDALAGLLCCCTGLGDPGEVRATAQAVWAELVAGITGMEFPLLAYEACVRAFEQLGEVEAAAAAAAAGHKVLMDQARLISDAGWRESFLHGIPEHRALFERQATSGGAGVSV